MANERDKAIPTDLGVLGIVHPISKKPNTSIMRGPEDAILYKKSKEERISGASREKHELCVSHVLPKGVSCPVRFENNGIYFCRIKDDCPLKLV